MEHLLIKVDSNNTSDAIKKFVNQFKDACIEAEISQNDQYYLENYGLSKQAFEQKLNTGIAQCILGMTSPWEEVKAQLLAKLKRNEKN